ncbi:MAG: MBG domain-containing protein [Verrucomicrobiota bacterium]
MSLIPALSSAAHPHELAPGIWPTFNNEVHDVLPLPDGSFIVGGGFQSVTINGTTTSRSRLVRINANGTLDTNFPTANSTVNCLATDAAGRIYIGGDFISLTAGATTTPRLRVARLTPSFEVDAAFNTATTGPTDTVLALAPVGDGSVYIGGQFDTVGGVTSAAVKRMAKLKANGTLDTGFTSGATNDVNTILRLSNGTLYVGGISNYWPAPALPRPGMPLARLVKLSASGGRDASFKSPDATTIINKVIQLKDGSIFAVGNQPNPILQTNHYAKRLNAASGADLGYAVTGHYGQAMSCAQQADGKILSGALGTFLLTSLTGALDSTFEIGTDFGTIQNAGYINTIKLDKNGRIFVGGNFAFNDGVNARSKFVVLNGTDPRSQSLTLPTPPNPTFAAGSNVYTLNPTSSSGLPVTLTLTSGNATLVGNKLTILGAGTVVVTATQAGNATFDPATPLLAQIHVPMQAQTISFAPLFDLPSGTAPFLLGASASSGLNIQYEVIESPATVSGNVLTLTGAVGTVTIRASQPGNVDFTAAAPVEQSFDVFQGSAASVLPQTIAFNPLAPRFVNEGPFSVSAASSSGLPVTITVTSGPATVLNGVVTLGGTAGTVVLTASQGGNANFLAAKAVVQNFKVNPLPTGTAPKIWNLVQTYDGTPKLVSTTAPVINYTINKVKGTTPPTAAGSYAVEVVDGTLKAQGTLVINKAPLFVVANDKRKFTGQPNPGLTLAYSGFAGGDHAGNSLTKAVTVTTKATTTSPGGNYPITPAGGAANNYALVYVNGNMKVESWAGQYEAIPTGGDPVVPVGKVEITVLANSTSYTGKFTTAKQTVVVPFTGTLTLDMNNNSATSTTTGVIGKAADAVTYAFTLTIPLDGSFTVHVTRATGTPAGTPSPFGMSMTGKKLFFPTGTPPVAYAGAHTLIIESPSHLTISEALLPNGNGYATAVIDAKGKMTLAGVLADGTKLTASLFPDKQRGYRLYALPYGARLDSYYAAWLDLNDHPDLPGRGRIPEGTQTSYWAKAAATKDVNYRSGFPATSNGLVLDPWLPPVTKPAVINLAQRLDLNVAGGVDVHHEGLPAGLTASELPATATVDAAGKVAAGTNSRGWKMAIAPATGIFTASHTALDGSKSITVNYTGIMRQPASTDDTPLFIGAGLGLVPQLTGQTAGSISSALYFEATAPDAN